MTSKIVYQGNLRTSATHLASNSNIETDAPVDNNGKGEKFSPTDLVATALASCMFTIMGMLAERNNINIDGSYAEVNKIMFAEPRRIGRVEINMYVSGQESYSEKEMAMLRHAALTCPVWHSLHPEMEKVVTFYFNGQVY
ncbi:MAG TPA: OsmC family protein [Edaphocola sp.]|nr:OsmC family protein [Edaphocola sp.]